MIHACVIYGTYNKAIRSRVLYGAKASTVREVYCMDLRYARVEHRTVRARHGHMLTRHFHRC